MGEVIYGVDFRRHRDEKPDPMVELAKEVMGLLDATDLWQQVTGTPWDATAPSETNPDADGA